LPATVTRPGLTEWTYCWWLPFWECRRHPRAGIVKSNHASLLQKSI